MKWIVLAILLCIIPYTYVTLRYRKAEPAFQPYEDMKNRANVMRLLNAGYRRIPLPAEVPADALKDQSSAPMQNLAGGFPAELKSTLAEPPALPVEITRVVAPASVRADHRDEGAGAADHERVGGNHQRLAGGERQRRLHVRSGEEEPVPVG